MFDTVERIAAARAGVVDNQDWSRGQAAGECWRLGRNGGEEATNGGLTVDGPAGSIHNM